ncbi:MAG: InlB B-repeat-containing protein, partial [Spirochaetales bacterium]|nr:InlB B-repeat-containing protein [Spirochaetales bacterium]
NNFITLSNDHTFTFVPYPDNPNKVIVDKYVEDNHTVSALTGLSRPDYKFEGWWTSLDNGKTLYAAFDFNAQINGNTVVYAKWIEITGGNGGGNHSGDSIPDTPSEGTYRIIFSAGESVTEYDGTMEPKDVSCDVSIDLPECAFSMLHYTFVGWNTSKDGKGASYADKSGVINLAAAGETVTLWAQWTENPKFFIYYHNDQDSENNRIQMVYKDVTNDKFKLCEWSKVGNEFLYWTTNLDTNDTTFDSEMTIVTDLTGDGGIVHLYPVWKPKTWTIEYKDQNNQPFSGSDNTSDWVKKYTYGTDVTLTTTSTKQYYDFGSWHLSADCTDDAINGIDGHAVYPGDTITLYAKWTPRTHSIIYMDQSGDNNWINVTETLSGARTSFAEHEDVTIDAVASKLGYGFAGWFANTTDTDSTDHWSAGDKTFDVILYAKWTQNEYTIKFNHNYDEMGVTISEPGNLIRDYGNTTDRLPTPSYSRSDYNMYGWNTSADGTGKHFEAGEILTEDLTTDDGVIVNLYAIWYSTTQAAIGDIVYDHTIDNSTNPHQYWYSPSYLQGKTPIGIVYDVTSDSSAGATSSIVRVAALEEAEEKMWCLGTANGYNVLFATSSDDGSNNWNIIKTTLGDASDDTSTTGNYPAFEYCNSRTEGGLSWYLPAKNELTNVFNNLTNINSRLTILNKDVINGSNFCWSSSCPNDSTLKNSAVRVNEEENSNFTKSIGFFVLPVTKITL